MKPAIDAWGTREWAATKRPVFLLPQTTLRCYVKDRQKSSSETIKTKVGRKQVLPCEVENDLAEHFCLTERKIFGLTMADVMHLAYLLAVRNGIKNQIFKRNEKTRRKWLKKFPTSSSSRNFSYIPWRSSLSRARGFTPESVAQYF